MNKILFFLILIIISQSGICHFENIISIDLNNMKRNSLVPLPAGWHLKKIDLSTIVEKSSYNVRPITVAVIDSGMDWNHPALKNHLYTNIKEIPGNGIDDDGNGYIDDVHGFNFLENNSNSMDENGHGTHVSGIIAADCNADKSMCGILKKVKILPLKFLDKNGNGPTSAAVAAIKYAVKMKVDIINASFGSEVFSKELYDVIKLAEDNGIIFVTAAGNYSKNIDYNPMYPASFDLTNIVSVAATDFNDNIDMFSNYGGKTVTVAAPGNDIYSTFKNSGYETLSGTSMATPIVTSLIGLMIQFRKNDYSKFNISEVTGLCTEVINLHDKVRCQGRASIYPILMNK